MNHLIGFYLGVFGEPSRRYPDVESELQATSTKLLYLQNLEGMERDRGGGGGEKMRMEDE